MKLDELTLLANDLNESITEIEGYLIRIKNQVIDNQAKIHYRYAHKLDHLPWYFANQALIKGLADTKTLLRKTLQIEE